MNSKLVEITNLVGLGLPVLGLHATGLDYYKTQGIYRLNSTILYHLPPGITSGNGTLVILNPVGGVVLQIYSGYDGKTWIRCYWYNGWGSWRTVAS